MAKATTVWGIDIGQCALKALKLREDDGRLTIEAIDIIEHPTVLSQSEGRDRELIHEALETFMSRNKLVGSKIAIAVPGQSSFMRFVKLPPVEPKKVPEIVRFEAEQQIPFAIDEVTWRWQTFQDPDSPDVEVGIFAMKRLDVEDVLQHFRDVELDVDVVQMAPLALYNFMLFDRQIADDGATLLMDVGTTKTDLVIADGGRLWTRTIQIGGSNFTEALVKAFKLSFPKAQKLKRSAATSKYARQIFQSMRPVFSDLVQEVQRSIGYYTSLHRDTRFKRLLGLGNGFRLPGLQRFLEQNLNIPVVRIDSYNSVSPGAGVNVPMFTENVLSFAVAYGTAVQTVAETPIHTNLLPKEIQRKRLWNSKKNWFAVAAGLVIAAMAALPYRAAMDSRSLDTSEDLTKAEAIYQDLQRVQDELSGLKKQGDTEQSIIQKHVDLFGYRTFWPDFEQVLTTVMQAERAATDQPLLGAYARGMQRLSTENNTLPAPQKRQGLDKQIGDILDMKASPADRAKAFDDLRGPLEGRLREARSQLSKAVTGGQSDSIAHLRKAVADAEIQVGRVRSLAQAQRDVQALLAIPRNRRRIMIIRDMKITYLPDISQQGGSRPPVNPMGRQTASQHQRAHGGFKIEFQGQTPLTKAQADDMLGTIRRRLGEVIGPNTGSDQIERRFPAMAYRAMDWLMQTAEVPSTPQQPGQPARIQAPDPMIPSEETIGDVRFSVALLISVESDGLGAYKIKPPE